jgi:flagellar basal body-associated protein FliL
MGPSERRSGIALVPVLAIACAVVAAASGAVVLALALTGGPPAQPAQAAQAAEQSDAPKAEEQSVFVPFGDAIANLAEDRLTRYVKVNITLQVNAADAEAVQTLMAGPKKALFSNWLITYLSDKTLQDVKGANAMNALRREIQDGFNALLAQDGKCKVESVLFKEFNVQ